MSKLTTYTLLLAGMMAMSVGLAADLKRSDSQPQPKIEINNAGQQHTGSSSAKELGIPFGANCASGFSKLGEQAVGGLDVNWFVCGTPVIKCPAQLQSNGKYASVTPTAIVKMVSYNPDGGEARFNVQYKCDYSFTPIPEG